MQLVHLGIDRSSLNPYISNTLLSGIEEALSLGDKVILYLNKRGQFSSIVCNDCQHLFTCKNCDISMSVHKYPSQFMCHLCTHTEAIPLACKKCEGVNLSHIGIGTQQIEESLKAYFQNTTIFRFDTDSMKTKKSKIEALESLHSADIIIGTKMITTGFNFERVGLIGIVLLEQELQIPKYNTEESVYINTRQLLGRGERVGQKTNFIIQSFIPNNAVIGSIVGDNYKDFFINTLTERKLFLYPPFGEIATLEYRNKSEQKALDFVTKIFNKLELELSSNNNVEVIFNKTTTKKYNQFYCKLILKGKNMRDSLKIIKTEVLRNSGLSITFD